MEKHPEIENLFGPDSRPVPYVIAIVVTQLALSYYQQFWSWPVFLLVSWVFGATASQALLLMAHELSHNLVFKSTKLNDAFGIFCNIGNGFPSATMFKRYHMEHHQFQGDSEKDTDIPTVWEGYIFTTAPLKVLWLMSQSLFYAIRPTIMRPKQFRTLDLINIVVVLFTNFLCIYFFGTRSIVYLLGSSLLGMGLHPIAGHFIAEHYIFVEGHETYSYYGALNLLTWNVGYHNEHHDFPRVAGWKLPQVKAMAPEFYDNLPHHTSWSWVLWQYITNPDITPFSRVRRYKMDPMYQGKSSMDGKGSTDDLKKQ